MSRSYFVILETFWVIDTFVLMQCPRFGKSFELKVSPKLIRYSAHYSPLSGGKPYSHPKGEQKNIKEKIALWSKF